MSYDPAIICTKSTEANCSREFPAETLSLQRRVERFSQSEGRTEVPHHRGYGSNVQFGRRTERAAPPNSYGG
ncbi:hypothetical protein ATANTOWER_027337 [Ataeniobius toweri]|uniref:Uncharacterized protein n=1 Tax=Ataeniobius toweri TaxID=208326 RepID=A0ABU7BUP8_9TELE|nr:hypothetical protein [Ataeniobius toweri]